MSVQSPQVALEGLRPQAEGGGTPKRVGPGREGDDLLAMSGGHFAGEAGFAHAGVAEQEHAAQLTVDGPGELTLEDIQLPVPADEPRARWCAGPAGPYRFRRGSGWGGHRLPFD